MDVLALIREKREHVARLSNQNGIAGEQAAVIQMASWIHKPKGRGMKNLMRALHEAGIPIKPSSFDALVLPEGETLDFDDVAALKRLLPRMTFIEIKTANQSRVQEDFGGFFFALTEREIEASAHLGDRHRVALYNKQTGVLRMTSVREILARARSTTWQLSVQL
jgi:hypothetical protein